MHRFRKNAQIILSERVCDQSKLFEASACWGESQGSFDCHRQKFTMPLKEPKLSIKQEFATMNWMAPDFETLDKCSDIAAYVHKNLANILRESHSPVEMEEIKKNIQKAYDTKISLILNPSLFFQAFSVMEALLYQREVLIAEDIQHAHRLYSVST
ncbi:MAG: hypothetical protein OXC30_00785 [Alphaproteobacteria bacterium]|nr:hypothetical protein [Alphaproteobacteria bacterium]